MNESSDVRRGVGVVGVWQKGSVGFNSTMLTDLLGGRRDMLRDVRGDISQPVQVRRSDVKAPMYKFRNTVRAKTVYMRGATGGVDPSPK